MAAALFTPFQLRDVTLPNRTVVSPMCQYAAEEGSATDWHLAHLGQLTGGAFGLVMVEATHVSPEGRITPACLGLWSDANERALHRVVAFCRRWSDAKLGIQLAHAGRKASTHPPLLGGGPLGPDQGAWRTQAPSALAYADWPEPAALDEAGIGRVRRDFVAAAKRAARLGFDVIELHMAHGYLLHSFLSPLSNRRTDACGGSLEGRMALPVQLFQAVRDAVPSLALGVRVSATDWVEGGWDLEQTIAFARLLRAAGCDFIDVSSGGLDPRQQIDPKPGYQLPFAKAVRAATALPTMAVGLITTPEQAEAAVADGSGDLVALGRGAMDDPHWPWHAAQHLGVDLPYPRQFQRAHPSRWQPAR